MWKLVAFGTFCICTAVNFSAAILTFISAVYSDGQAILPVILYLAFLAGLYLVLVIGKEILTDMDKPKEEKFNE